MIPDLSCVKKLRKRAGLSQKELSKLVNVSQSYVNKIENGVADPPFNTAKRIIEFLESLQKDNLSVRACDLMTSINSVKSSDDLITAIALMNKLRISQVPVIDEGVSVGCINTLTIPQLLLRGFSDFKNLKINEVMSDSFPLMPENSPIKLISELLNYHQAVLLTSKGCLTGIITGHDLSKLV